MFKSQRWRWGLLLSALAATIAAIMVPEDEPVIVVQPPQPKRAVSLSPVAAQAVPVQELAREWLASDDNPFAPRGWIAPPPAPPPVQPRTVAPVVLTETTPPPPAPLPFRFLGSMSDGDDRVIYLGQGEQLLTAREGDVLEGRYKVARISAAHIEFEDTTSGLRQGLPLPAQDK